MSKLLTCLVLAGFGLGLNIASAQNVDSDKTNAQGQAKGNAEKGVSAQAAGAPKDCTKLSGPEKDKCIQATPAGPVEMDTGEKSTGKSEIAKERDRMKDQSSNDNAAPAQSADSLGRPNDGKKGAATGQSEDTSSARNEQSAPQSQEIPQQSMPSVGHPAEGGQTGQFGERKFDQSSQPEGESEATKR